MVYTFQRKFSARVLLLGLMWLLFGFGITFIFCGCCIITSHMQSSVLDEDFLKILELVEYVQTWDKKLR